MSRITASPLCSDRTLLLKQIKQRSVLEYLPRNPLHEVTKPKRRVSTTLLASTIISGHPVLLSLFNFSHAGLEGVDQSYQFHFAPERKSMHSVIVGQSLFDNDDGLNVVSSASKRLKGNTKNVRSKGLEKSEIPSLKDVGSGRLESRTIERKPKNHLRNVSDTKAFLLLNELPFLDKKKLSRTVANLRRAHTKTADVSRNWLRARILHKPEDKHFDSGLVNSVEASLPSSFVGETEAAKQYTIDQLKTDFLRDLGPCSLFKSDTASQPTDLESTSRLPETPEDTSHRNPTTSRQAPSLLMPEMSSSVSPKLSLRRKRPWYIRIIPDRFLNSISPALRHRRLHNIHKRLLAHSPRPQYTVADWRNYLSRHRSLLNARSTSLAHKGESLVHTALRLGNWDALEAMRSLGASGTRLTRKGITPLMCLADSLSRPHCSWEKSSCDRDVDGIRRTVNWLLEEKRKEILRGRKKCCLGSRPPLTTITEEVDKALANYVNTQDDRGQTALHLAIQKRREGPVVLAFIKSLLQAGAKPSIVDYRSLSPMTYASRMRLREIFPMLQKYASPTPKPFQLRPVVNEP